MHSKKKHISPKSVFYMKPTQFGKCALMVYLVTYILNFLHLMITTRDLNIAGAVRGYFFQLLSYRKHLLLARHFLWEITKTDRRQYVSPLDYEKANRSLELCD